MHTNGDSRELLAQGSTVGSTFLQYVDYLGVYVSYCNNMEVQEATVKRLRQESPAFEDFVQSCKARPECRQQDISSFLVKPFQRLFRYPLLLEAILRYSEPGPEADRIRKVITKIQVIGKRINKQKKQLEGNPTVADLQQRLNNPTGAIPLLISPARVFIRHGVVYEIDPSYSRPVCTTSLPLLSSSPCCPHPLSASPSAANARLHPLQRPVCACVQAFWRHATRGDQRCASPRRVCRAPGA